MITAIIECPWCGGRGSVITGGRDDPPCTKCDGSGEMLNPTVYKLNVLSVQSDREYKRLKIKYKDILDIPPIMSDRLVFPMSAIASSTRRLRITRAIIDLKRDLRHDDAKIVERLIDD